MKKKEIGGRERERTTSSEKKTKEEEEEDVEADMFPLQFESHMTILHCRQIRRR
jgi:hypothetical protein